MHAQFMEKEEQLQFHFSECFLTSIFDVVGNERFRKLVKHSAPLYQAARTKLEKTQVIASVVEKVRRDSPGGGFVKQDTESGLWYEIGDDKARDKVGHAIRRYLDYKPQSKDAAATNSATFDVTRSVPKSTTAPRLPLPSLDDFAVNSGVEKAPQKEDSSFPREATISMHHDGDASTKSGDHSLFALRQALLNEKLDSIVVPSFVFRQANPGLPGKIESSDDDAHGRTTVSTKSSTRSTKEPGPTEASLLKGDCWQGEQGNEEGTFLVGSNSNNFAAFPYPDRIVPTRRGDSTKQTDDQLSSLLGTFHASGDIRRSSVTGSSSEFHFPQISLLPSSEGQHHSLFPSKSLNRSMQPNQVGIFGRDGGVSNFSNNNNNNNNGGGFLHTQEFSSADNHHGNMSSLLGLTMGGGRSGVVEQQSPFNSVTLPSHHQMIPNRSSTSDNGTIQWPGTTLSSLQLPGTNTGSSSFFGETAMTSTTTEPHHGNMSLPSFMSSSNVDSSRRALENHATLHRDLNLQQLQLQQQFLMQLLQAQEGGNTGNQITSHGTRLGDSTALMRFSDVDDGDDTDDIFHQMLSGRRV